jgi:hypothetical protein
LRLWYKRPQGEVDALTEIQHGVLQLVDAMVDFRLPEE